MHCHYDDLLHAGAAVPAVENKVRDTSSIQFGLIV